MRRTLTALLAAACAPALAMENDDPLIASVLIEELEWRADGSDSGAGWDIQGWLGYDINKFRFKTEGEWDDKEDVETADVQALYSRAIAPYWDIQAGWRRELEPGADRDWAVIGIQGLAPWHFEVDASLFVGESGRTAARVEAEYEFLLTQRWILAPRLELNAHGKDDPERGIGSGLSNIETGLRLRYEFRRQFAPYIGIHHERLFGDTADYAEAEGHGDTETRWVLGLRAWF